MTITEWFWDRVDKTETCWVWAGPVALRGGYGVMWDGTAKIKAYHFVMGKPTTGHEWHHRCENVLCVRPEHLQLLTKTEHRRVHASHPRP